jgi:pimeloyl-ACP methyl ester carboxylesterase
LIEAGQVEKPMLPVTRMVEIGGAPIHLAEWGAGPRVLLIHGNPDSGLMWEGVADRLAARFIASRPICRGLAIPRCRVI